MKTITVCDIELEPIFGGDNCGKVGDYVRVEATPWGNKWLSLKEARKVANAIVKMADKMEEVKNRTGNMK